MERNERVFIVGIGVDDPKGIFGTTLESYKSSGEKSVPLFGPSLAAKTVYEREFSSLAQEKEFLEPF